MRSIFLNILLAAGLGLILSACGGGSSAGSGTLSLSMTDAPVVDEDIEAVWVRVTGAILHPASGPDIVVDVIDDDGITPYRDIELTSLTGGATQLLGEYVIPAGNYSWIRLVIDPNHTLIVEKTAGTPDTIHPPALLDCSSCDESHLKLVRSFSIASNGRYDFLIDFDLQKSLTLQLPQSTKPRPDYAYKLRPTLRILDTQLASTFIWGSVTDTRLAPVTGPADPGECSVYTYAGDMATVNPDDICVPVDAFDTSCDAVDNQRPLDIAQVSADTVNNDGTFDYRTGALSPGIYTLAMVCEPDDPDLDDPLTFIGEQEVDATLDPPSPLGTGPVNFELN
jgi:hypothetical protein